MKPILKREIKILSVFLILGFLLYADSTAVKSWRYPLELSPENKQIEKIVALSLLYYGYITTVIVRFLIFLIRKFIKYVS